MYLDFFGLREKPFQLTPNPHFLYLSSRHREALAHLLYGLQDEAGFIAITGEVGAGKTTVLRTLFGQLDDKRYRLAFIFNPRLGALDLLKVVNRELGLEASGANSSDLTDTLNTFLLQQREERRVVVLVIDEAQNLDPAVLEQVRMLSNLETEDAKLIQIVLVGQPELRDILARHDMRQLAQRITVRCHLGTMNLEETAGYIDHRMEVAGGYPGIFSRSAVKRIYRFSGGLPRLINVVCGRALLAAYAENKKIIDKDVIKASINDIGDRRRFFFWPRGVFR